MTSALADEDAAGADGLEAGDQPQEGGLAATRGADEDHELAVGDVEADVVHRGDVRSEHLRDAFQTDAVAVAPGSGRGLAGVSRCLDIHGHLTVTQPSNAFAGAADDASATTVTDPADTTSADEVPTRNSNEPGSTTNSRSRPWNPSWPTGISNATVADPPAGSATRAKLLSSSTGLVTLAAVSWT